MLEVLTKELIKLNVEAKDWQEAIKLSAQALVDQKKILPSYVNAIIENVKESGPYIAIAPHVAIPHARQDKGVLDNAIGLAVLKEPVVFGNPTNDPIKYLFCLSAVDNHKHLQSLTSLAFLLEDKDFYRVLDQAKNAEEILAYIEKFEREKHV